MKKEFIVSVTLLCAIAFTGCAPDLTGVMLEPETSATSITTEEISFKPGEDFYGFSNYDYISSLTYDPKNGGAGSFAECFKITNNQVKELILDIANGNPDSYEKGSNEDIIYKLYWQLKNSEPDAAGLMTDEEFDKYLEDVKRVNDVTSYSQLFELMGEFEKEYNPSFLGIYTVAPGITDSSKNAFIYYQMSIPGIEMKELSKGAGDAVSMRDTVKQMLKLTGVDSVEADKRATELVYVFIDIAKESNHELGDDLLELNKQLTRFSKEEINQKYPHITYDGLMTIIGADKNIDDDIYIADAKQIACFDSKLTDENLPIWKDYVVAAMLNNSYMMFPVSKGGRGLNLESDDEIVDTIKRALYCEVGEVYASKYFNQEKIDDVNNIIHEIIGQYKVFINESKYSPDAKKKMIKKLDNMVLCVGAGEMHKINPNDSNLIGKSFYETYCNFSKKSYKEEIEKLGTKADRNAFNSMAPNTVNACYIPETNSINITLAILNEPFYSASYSRAQKLGGIGLVIGHEISHGFDDYGINFDEYGSFNPDRFSNEDQEIFNELQQKVTKYYSNFTVLTYYHVDGENTLGENLADISGLQCVLSLVKTDEEKREVFSTFAKCFAELTTNKAAIEQIYSDVHSPGRVRVNAVVALMDDFYEVYDIDETDSLYVKPEDRVLRW